MRKCMVLGALLCVPQGGPLNGAPRVTLEVCITEPAELGQCEIEVSCSYQEFKLGRTRYFPDIRVESQYRVALRVSGIRNNTARIQGGFVPRRYLRPFPHVLRVQGASWIQKTEINTRDSDEEFSLLDSYNTGSLSMDLIVRLDSIDYDRAGATLIDRGGW